MRVSTLLSALTTFALLDVAFCKDHTAPWRRSKHNAHRRQYAPVDGSNYIADGGASNYGQATSDDSGLQKITGREFELVRRYDNGKFSFYDAGLGACGIWNTGDDFIVALNSAQFDSGNYCFKKITIQINGKSTQATITDRCPGCPYGGLDFSRGLFKFFAEESVGIIHGEWHFGGEAPPPPPPPPVPVIIEEPSPPPPPAPSSTKTTSTSSTATSTSSASSTASASGTSGTSSAATPSNTWKPEEHHGCIESLDMAMIHLAGMIASGARVGQATKAY